MYLCIILRFMISSPTFAFLLLYTSKLYSILCLFQGPILVQDLADELIRQRKLTRSSLHLLINGGLLQHLDFSDCPRLITDEVICMIADKCKVHIGEGKYWELISLSSSISSIGVHSSYRVLSYFRESVSNIYGNFKDIIENSVNLGN